MQTNVNATLLRDKVLWRYVSPIASCNLIKYIPMANSKARPPYKTTDCDKIFAINISELACLWRVSLKIILFLPVKLAWPTQERAITDRDVTRTECARASIDCAVKCRIMRSRKISKPRDWVFNVCIVQKFVRRRCSIDAETPVKFQNYQLTLKDYLVALICGCLVNLVSVSGLDF